MSASVNYRTDFKTFEVPAEGAEYTFSVPFRFSYYTTGATAFVASHCNGEYNNCELLEDGRLKVTFDNHGLAPGRVLCRREFYLTDEDYNDGICNAVFDTTTDIFLTLSGSDLGDITVELPPFYQKGDPFKWEDMTAEQRDYFIEQVGADVVATNEAVIAAEAQRVIAENERSERFESVMQEATTQAGYAKEQGDYAKEQGDYAKTQGEYAFEQGDYAMGQGDYAMGQGDYAYVEAEDAKKTNQDIKDAEAQRVLAEQERGDRWAELSGELDAAITQAGESSSKADKAALSASTAATDANNAIKEMQQSFDNMVAEVEEMLDQIANGEIGSGGGGGIAVKHTSDEQVVTIEPNTFHVWDSVYMLNVTLGEAKEGEKSEYLFQFTAGVWLDECLIDAPFPLRFDTSLEWKYGHTYLVHIVNGNGTVYEYEPYVPEDEIWFYTDGTLIAPNLSNLSDKYGPIAYTYDASAGKHILKIEGVWIREIPAETFAYSNIWSVMLPSTGAEIGNYAFSDCENLQNIYMPFAWKIGIEAFRDCPISGIIDLEYCESIGEGAFEGTSINEITIPESITTIPVNCFYGCWNLNKVKLSEGLKVIGDSAFSDCSNLKDITIPSTVELIGQEAFLGCIRIKSIEIPSGVLELFNRCFAGCTSLEEVIWHEGKSGVDSRSIYSQVFSGCTNLRKVTIPEGVVDIQHEVFANTAISTLVLPSTVADIDSYAFGQMPNLQTIYCKAPRTPYVDSGFMMQVSTIYVPEGVVGNYQSANGWSEFANVIVGHNFAGPWDANLANYYDKRELPEPAAYVLNTEQTLTEEQKEQARKNIGAASTSYIISVFEEIKALIKNGDYDEVVAVLDKAILDFATLG